MATPQVTRIGGVRRQDGLQTPNLLAPARWVDAFVLVQNVVETYTLPVDAAGNRATILRFNTGTAVTLYGRWDGVAAVPAADITDGTSSMAIAAFIKPRLLAAPKSSYTLSLITNAAAGAVVTIEAWS